MNKGKDLNLKPHEVPVVNYQQARKYMENGVYPLRCELGYNEKILFIFDKVEANEVFHLWLNYKL